MEQTRVQPIAPALWEQHIHELLDAYPGSNGTQRVINTMIQRCYVQPTRQQVIHQMRKWQALKNLKSSQAEQMWLNPEKLTQEALTVQQKVRRHAQRSRQKRL